VVNQKDILRYRISSTCSNCGFFANADPNSLLEEPEKIDFPKVLSESTLHKLQRHYKDGVPRCIRRNVYLPVCFRRNCIYEPGITGIV
jgi:hypothetical protein